jgi:ABC-type multidrug transport system fused ATPase/permease subunit
MLCHLLLTCCSVGFVYVSKMMVDGAVAVYEGSADISSLSVWAVAMAGVIVVRILLGALRSFLQARTDVKMRNRLRARMFDALLHLQNDGGERRHTGDLLNRVLEDVRVVSSAISVSLPNLVGASLQFAAALAFLLWLDVRLALVIALVVPLGVLGGRFVTRRVRKMTHDIRSTDSKVQSHLQESMQNLTVLQTMEYTDASSSSLGDLQSALYTNEIRRARFSIFSRIIISLTLSAGHAFAFIWGAYGLSTGAVSFGMMTAFLQLVGQIQRPLMELSQTLPSLIHALASVDRIIEIEDLPSEKSDESIMLEGAVGVRLDSVCFAYPDSADDVISDFSYDFTPGSKTAIVGPTGVGKSTLIRLLLSLLHQRSGQISLYSEGGKDLVPMSVSTRCNLVYVPQGNSLFSGSIRDNLLVGNPEATDQQMFDALSTAAADFVRDLPYGLDTQCFEKGAGLSEGQAQRIAIARALLRPGKILLLDEFSSALDAQTETLLLERLTATKSDRTIIFITHRERVIDYCDATLALSKEV